jgi:hypothetical protein
VNVMGTERGVLDTRRPTQRIRIFLLVEAATFVLAALTHAGVLVTGYEHQEAQIAESVIAGVLLVGFVVTLVRPAWSRQAGVAAQGFALLGTLVGLTTIAVGIGPRTVPDVVYHVAIVLVLIWGLLLAARTDAD